MRLSRTDLVPVLTIVAGGVIGASFTFSFLSRPDGVSAPDPVVALSATSGDRIEADRVEISPDEQWIMLYIPDTDGGEPRVYVRRRKDGTGRVDLSFRPDVESQERPLFYIDGVRFGSSDLSLKLDAIESIETVSGDAAVALYGGEAFAGVVRISLKEERP